jgi:hypothetical protein
VPNVRKEKRRTVVMSDELWDDVLGTFAYEQNTTRGAVLRGLVEKLPRYTPKPYPRRIESGEEPADAADA